MAVRLRLVLTLVFASLGGVASAAAFDAGTATAPAATRGDAVTAPAAASRSAPTLPPFPSTLCPGYPATSFDGAHLTRFLARTVAEVLANAPDDAGVRYVLEGIVGVHGAGMWDQQAPDCRPNLLELGPPLFVRRYPATTGAWLIPISYLGTPLETIYLSRGDDGFAELAEVHGGAPSIVDEAVARHAAGTTSDPVASAELVFANLGCGGDAIVWRLVRRSGTAVFFVPGYPGAPAPGALFREDEMRFRSLIGRPAGLAKPVPAC